MAATPDTTDARVRLLASVDDLATRAMLADESEAGTQAAISALTALADEAKSAGIVRVAEIASELAGSLGASDSPGPALLDGITRIQAAIDDSSASSAPATEQHNDVAAWAADPEMVSEFFM